MLYEEEKMDSMKRTKMIKKESVKKCKEEKSLTISEWKKGK